MDQKWMHDALVFASAGATLVGVVIVLWLFADARQHFKRRRMEKTGLTVNPLPGLQTPGTVVVRLKDGTSHAGLRLAGVLDDSAARNAGLPFTLSRMVCVERDDGARIWIDANAIRVMEYLPERAPPG